MLQYVYWCVCVIVIAFSVTLEVFIMKDSRVKWNSGLLFDNWCFSILSSDFHKLVCLVYFCLIA